MIEAEERKIENEKRLRELSRAYKRVFSSEDGKIVLKDLEFQCGQNRTSADGDFSTNKTFFHEGMRNMFLYINLKLNRDNGEKEND